MGLDVFALFVDHSNWGPLGTMKVRDKIRSNG